MTNTLVDLDRDISGLPEETQTYIKSIREECKARRLKASELEGKITERDAAVAAALTKHTELEGKVATLTQLQTDYNGLKDQHAQTLAATETAKLELTRLRAAVEVGLPHTFADRLKGDDEAALKADAKALKDQMGTGTPATGVAFDKTDPPENPDSAAPQSDLAAYIRQALSQESE